MNKKVLGSALLLALMLPIVGPPARASAPIRPSEYPSNMPFYVIDPPTGHPVFLVGASTYWDAFCAVGQDRNLSNQQLAAAWLLYLHHVKGLQFVPQATEAQVLATRDIVVAGYRESGLKSLIDAHLAGRQLPQSVVLDSWMNIARNMRTIAAAGSASKGHACKACDSNETPSVYCPNSAFPCVDKCDGTGAGCYDLAAELGSARFIALINMSLD